MKISNAFPLFINRANYRAVTQGNNSSQLTLNTLSSDVVSFGSHKKPKLFIKDARELEDLPCACCGNPMLVNSKANNFLEEKLYYPASVSLHLMREEGFNLSEQPKDIRLAYEFLLAYSNSHKGLTIDQILSKEEVKDYRRHLSPQHSRAFDEIKELSKLVARSSSAMIKEISKLNPHFQPTERKAFEELKQLSCLYPDETFYEILNKPEIKNIYLKNLLIKQTNILKNISLMKEDLPRRYQFELQDVIDEAMDIFTNENENIKHKRKRVIAAVEAVLDRIKNNKTSKTIIAEINKLPDSKTDVDAFMIKSSQKTSNSLAETLVSRVRNTREHVTPHHREGDNGESNIHNYTYMCGKCNGDRGQESYSTVVDKKPDMPENQQKQMDFIIRQINQGKLIGYDDYPNKIKEKLHIESGGNEHKRGKIDIDISRFDRKMAIENRRIRKCGLAESEKMKSKKRNKTKIF